MLAIKFRRVGKKHQVSYRIVVDQKRSKLLGMNIEDLGWYSPMTKKTELKADRVKYWIEKGAKPTDTVHNLFVREGIVEGKKRPVHKFVKPEAKAGEAPAAEAKAGVVS